MAWVYQHSHPGAERGVCVRKRRLPGAWAKSESGWDWSVRVAVGLAPMVLDTSPIHSPLAAAESQYMRDGWFWKRRLEAVPHVHSLSCYWGSIQFQESHSQLWRSGGSVYMRFSKKKRLSSDGCFAVVQSLSGVWLFATPWTAARQASLSFTISWNLLKLMSIELVMPSSHLILCGPLLLLPSISPSIGVFSNESALHIRWPKDWSFSFSISLSNEYSGLISFRIDRFNLLAFGSLYTKHRKRDHWLHTLHCLI